MFGGNFLTFFGVQVVQVGLGEFASALFGHGAFDHSHGVFGQDADGWVDRIDLAFTKLAVDRDHFGLERDQHVTNAALQEGGGGVASALGQHGHVLEQLAHKLGGLCVGAALLLHITPGSQIGITAIATGLGVDHDHLDAGLDEVVPVLDGLGVAVAGEEQHGGRGGGCVVGELLVPVLGHHTGVGEEVDVGRGVHGHHVGIQAIGHGACHGAGACVGLVDLHVFAGGLLVMGDEGCVVILVELTCHVVRAVEQGGLGKCCARGGKNGGGDEGLDLECHAASKDGVVNLFSTMARTGVSVKD